MVFNTFDRGVLEQLFESSIKNMKINVDVARDNMFHNILNDKDGVDLALGLALGTLTTSFSTGFKLRNQRPMNTDENTELFRIIESRLGQLREAIFQCG